MECEVCLTQFGPIVSTQDFAYYFLLYHVTFGLFYYFCFALLLAIYWITHGANNSVHQRFSDVTVFCAIIVCIHPILVTLAYIAVAVQHYVSHPFAAGHTVMTYTTFVKRKGMKV